MKNFDKEKVDKLYIGPGLGNENRFFNFMDHAHLLTDKEFWYGFAEAILRLMPFLKIRTMALATGKWGLQRFKTFYNDRL
ncbi:MAG: hypothetical protein IPO02_03780 [Bacteroidetes bacterium]|nr:hypothetical protein [Bacteroidota bacterium]